MYDKNEPLNDRLKNNGSYLKIRYPSKTKDEQKSYLNEFSLKNSYSLKWLNNNWFKSISALDIYQPVSSLEAITSRDHFYHSLKIPSSYEFNYLNNINYHANNLNKSNTGKIERRKLRPNMHELIYALADKNQEIFNKLSDDEIEQLNDIFFHERYTIKDYKALHTNMAFGKFFNKKKEYDFETVDEKRERKEKAKELGNAYLKDQVNKNKKKLSNNNEASEHRGFDAKNDIKEINFYLKHLIRQKLKLEEEQYKPPTVQSDKNVPLSTNFTQDYKTKHKLEEELYALQFNKKKLKEKQRLNAEKALRDAKQKKEMQNNNINKQTETKNKNQQTLLSGTSKKSTTETFTTSNAVDDEDENDEENDALTLFEHDLKPRNEIFDEILEAYDTLPPLPGTSGSNVVFVSHSAMKLREDGYPIIDLDNDQRIVSISNRRSTNSLYPMSV